jgi:D-amino peptidase
MRVFIISDMEGVAGITRWEQVSATAKGYEEGRLLYTEEINAAVRGAYDGGATEVVVMDCHGAGDGWSFNSVVPERLDDRCEWVVQTDWTEYTGFLEEGCDAALFIAMHAMAGTADGVLSHTVSGTEWRNLRFNGTLVGETGINAALCGMWDCPVLLVTGDDATCREATALLGEGLTTARVKTGLGRFSARHVPPQRARTLIEAGAKQALADVKAVSPYRLDSPCEIEVELASSDLTVTYKNRAGIELKDSRTIVSRADDWWTAWKQVYL